MTAPAIEYAQGLERGVILFQRCRACGAAVFHPRIVCPHCASVELEWHESTGRGAVYAASTWHDRDRAPFTIALVECGEGFRLMARLEGFVDDDLGAIGARVTLRVESIDGTLGPVAHPADADG